MISQDPNSGTGMKGDEITLVQSLGPVLVTVPNVRAMGIRAAEQVMKDAGFKTRSGRRRSTTSASASSSTTDPRARTKAPKGSTITLYVV